MRHVLWSVLTILLASPLSAVAQKFEDISPTKSPTKEPPPPPANTPPPPTEGQWVYTEQYGWVWMPYGSEYTYEPSSNDAVPYGYVYTPTYGWSWLEAPW